MSTSNEAVTLMHLRLNVTTAKYNSTFFSKYLSLPFCMDLSEPAQSVFLRCVLE